METVIGLILTGAILLFLETILPGLIAGILGLLCLIAGIVVGFSRFGATTGTWILIAVSALLLAMALAYVKVFPTSRIARRFMSDRQIGGIGAEHPELLHQTGIAQTNLRPSGMALINGHRVDVVAESGLIEKGRSIKVIALEGFRVVVRAI